jgi:hypothetical protein
MFKSTGVLEKAILLAAGSSIPPQELVVAVAAAAGVDVVAVEEEVVEAAQAPQRRHQWVPMRRFQSMRMSRKSRLNTENNPNGRPHNNLILMDTILANTRTPHPTLHGRILKI